MGAFAPRRLPGCWDNNFLNIVIYGEIGLKTLKSYIAKRKSCDSAFAQDYESGYEKYKIGAILKIAGEEAGLTQDQLAKKLNAKKTAISHIENHTKDI